MRYADATLDQIFRVLANPTRRAVVARLGTGPKPVSELAEPFGMALPSFMQHIEMLEECGVVSTEKIGRSRICTLNFDPLQAGEGWLAEQRRIWEERLERLDSYLLKLHRERTDHK
jgi:DNA-binding transcriptional ArsR family regulator